MSIRLALKAVEALIRDPRQFSVPATIRTCPVCGYEGRFYAVGTPPRWDGRCPSCGSRERHRLFQLFLNELGTDLAQIERILHVAPEKHVRRMLAGKAGYVSIDVVEGKADRTMDVADLRFEDNSLDMIIVNHVLEHVPDDGRAMAEIGRCLAPGGMAVVTVPQVWSRPTTFATEAADSAAARYAHFQDADHLRYYGADFAALFAKASGLTVETWRMPQEQEARYGLYRDDVLFVGRKA